MSHENSTCAKLNKYESSLSQPAHPQSRYIHYVLNHVSVWSDMVFFTTVFLKVPESSEISDLKIVLQKMSTLERKLDIVLSVINSQQFSSTVASTAEVF